MGAAPSIYAQYRYDPVGNRTIKIVRRGNSAPDITVYIDGLFERLILNHATTAATTHDTIHILDDHARIGVLRRGAPVPGDPYPDATYHLGDHLSSSTAVLDPRRPAPQPRGIHPLRRNVLRQLQPQALSLHQQRTRRRKRAQLSRRPLLHAVAGNLDLLRPQ